MTDFYDFTTKRRATRIDPTKPFSVKVDLSKLVMRSGAIFSCSECYKELVRIEPGGILGEELNQLDTAVILDHYLEKHNG